MHGMGAWVCDCTTVSLTLAQGKVAALSDQLAQQMRHQPARTPGTDPATMQLKTEAEQVCG